MRYTAHNLAHGHVLLQVAPRDDKAFNLKDITIFFDIMQEGILYDLSFFDSLRGVLLRILNYKQKSLSLKNIEGERQQG